MDENGPKLGLKTYYRGYMITRRGRYPVREAQAQGAKSNHEGGNETRGKFPDLHG